MAMKSEDVNIPLPDDLARPIFAYTNRILERGIAPMLLMDHFFQLFD